MIKARIIGKTLSGHTLSSVAIHRYVYRFVALAVAEPSINARWTQERVGAPTAVNEDEREAEISHALINVAVAVRAAHDAAIRLGAEWRDSDVGHLWSNDGRKRIPLSLREACNKLIHATHIEYRWRTEGETVEIVLYGERNSKEWSAAFEVFSFADAVFAATPR